MPTQMFSDPTRTYKTYANAKKVIDKLQEGNYKWLIGTTEEGRFFPVVLCDNNDISFHYFIENGCCVHLI